jgi:outer membrane protein assembly factor BamB
MCMLAVIALAMVAGSLGGEEWPRWRGPRGDGTWNAPKLPEKWPVNGLKVAWKQPVGGGYAGIIAAQGRVFTLDLEAPIPPRPKGAIEDGNPDGTERVLCFDAKTGKEPDYTRTQGF